MEGDDVLVPSSATDAIVFFANKRRNLFVPNSFWVGGVDGDSGAVISTFSSPVLPAAVPPPKPPRPDGDGGIAVEARDLLDI